MNRKPYFFLIGALLLALVAGLLAHSYTSKSWPFSGHENEVLTDKFDMPDNSGTIDIKIDPALLKKEAGIDGLAFSGEKDENRIGGYTMMTTENMRRGEKLYWSYAPGASYELPGGLQALASPRKLTNDEVRELEEKIPDPKRYKEVAPDRNGPFFVEGFHPRLELDKDSFTLLDLRAAYMIGSEFKADGNLVPTKTKYFIYFDDSKNRWFVSGIGPVE